MDVHWLVAGMVEPVIESELDTGQMNRKQLLLPLISARQEALIGNNELLMGRLAELHCVKAHLAWMI